LEKEAHKDIPKPTKKKRFRFLKIIGRIVLGILALLFLLILFIRSPWGQDIIVTKAVSFLSNKTHTKVEVEKLFITFDGDIQLDGLYLEDTKGDTLIYSKSLEANMPLWSLIQGNGIGVDALDWKGVRANIVRTDTVQGFNFQFLIDAFTSQNTTTVATDTTSSSINLILGHLYFEDFDVVYNDAVTGIESRFKVGELIVDMDETDLESMIFKASELELTHSDITFIQTAVPKTEDSESSTLPTLTVDELTLTKVFANYQNQTDNIAAILDIEELYTEIPKVDLVNQQFEITEFSLKDSSITLKTETEKNAVTEKVEEVSEDIEQDILKFEWPDLQLDLAEIELENNNFSYLVNNETGKKGVFN